MLSQEMVQSKFLVVHGLMRMHGLPRNNDMCVNLTHHKVSITITDMKVDKSTQMVNKKMIVYITEFSLCNHVLGGRRSLQS